MNITKGPISSLSGPFVRGEVPVFKIHRHHLSTACVRLWSMARGLQSKLFIKRIREEAIIEFIWIGVAVLLSTLVLAIIGVIATLKFLFAKKRTNRRASEPLSRWTRLEIVEELCRDEMPQHLVDELAQMRAPKHSSPIPPTPAEDAEPEIDLGDSLIDGPLPIDSGPLKTSPLVEKLAARGRPGLAAFLSFENVIFVLSAMLILGGSLYLAAVTWNKVPGQWQFLFVELVTIFYGMLMLLGGRLLNDRLELNDAARILVAIATAVGSICAIIAAAAFGQHVLAGLLGSLAAALFAWISSRQLLRFIEGSRGAAKWYALSTLPLGLTGSSLVEGSTFIAALVLVSAAVIAVGLFAPGDTRGGSGYVFALTALIPLAGLLLTLPGVVPMAAAAPSLVVLAWLGVNLRERGHRWAPIASVALAGAGLVASVGSVGALAVSSLIGVGVGMRISAPPTPDDDDSAMKLDGPLTIAILSAAILWVLLSGIWSPAIGLLMPQGAIDWLIDLVTGPGERVSASWAGLAALPSLLLALWQSDRWRKAGDPRKAFAENAALGILVMGSAASLATYDRQPVPTGIILLLLSAAWSLWSFHRDSSWRHAIALIGFLAAAFSLGSAFDELFAIVAPATLGVIYMAISSRSARLVSVLTIPVLLVASMLAPIWSMLLWLTFGLLVLVQPGSRKIDQIRPIGPLSLMASWLVFAFLTPHGLTILTEGNHVLAVIGASLIPAALWQVVRRGSRFLTLEIQTAGVAMGLLATVSALGHSAGSVDALIDAGTAVVTLGCLLLTTLSMPSSKAQPSWLFAMWLLPLALVPVLDTDLAGHGAVAALLASAVLLFRSHRTRQPWLAGFGFLESLVAVVWGTLVLARPFSSGGGVARVLTVVAVSLVLVGVVIALWGRRISGAYRSLVRVFSTICIMIATGASLTGMWIVSSPQGIDQIFALASLLGVAGFSLLHAHRSRTGWPIHLSQAAFFGIYAYVRVRTGLLDALDGYDGLMVALAAFALVGISHFLKTHRIRLGVTESRRAAALLPLVIPFVMDWNGDFSDSMGMAVAGAAYALMARLQGGQRFAWMAVLALNLMLIPIWSGHGVDSAMAYLMPAGLTLLFMERRFRTSLEGIAPVLRTLAALLIPGSTSAESFRVDNLLPAVVLAALSIGAVLLGLAWRQRAYVHLGFVFLLMDMLVNLTQWGMESRLIAGGLGETTGLALFALGVSVARHKVELLARYRHMQEWSW